MFFTCLRTKRTINHSFIVINVYAPIWKVLLEKYGKQKSQTLTNVQSFLIN